MSEYGALVVPKLTPETVRVFIAEDDEDKREAVVASLHAFGLGESIQLADSYDKAAAVMEAQVPGNLSANVFLLDGNLDDTPNMWHGKRLANILARKYMAPLEELVDNATNVLKEGGLTRRQISEIVKTAAVHDIAAQRLGAEALLVGISRVDKGELGHPAQIPRADYKTVGETVYNTVIPVQVRNKIAKQRRKAADRARSQAAQA